MCAVCWRWTGGRKRARVVTTYAFSESRVWSNLAGRTARDAETFFIGELLVFNPLNPQRHERLGRRDPWQQRANLLSPALTPSATRVTKRPGPKQQRKHSRRLKADSIPNINTFVDILRASTHPRHPNMSSREAEEAESHGRLENSTQLSYSR
jgi:hypothetical protein